MTMTLINDILKESTERRIFCVYQTDNLERERPNRFSVDRLGLSFLLGDSMETNICYKYKEEKDIKEFYPYFKFKKCKYHRSYCISCIKKYRRRNKEHHRKYTQKWRKLRYEKYPWTKWISLTRSSAAVMRSHGRNIIANISIPDLKKLWFRDKAWLLKETSLDRIDSDGNYTFKNCRFIELSENRARPKTLTPMLLAAHEKQRRRKNGKDV